MPFKAIPIVNYFHSHLHILEYLFLCIHLQKQTNYNNYETLRKETNQESD